MKALVGAFNQEKALVGAFSVIVQPVVEPMDRFAALEVWPFVPVAKDLKDLLKPVGGHWSLIWDKTHHWGDTFFLVYCQPLTNRKAVQGTLNCFPIGQLVVPDLTISTQISNLFSHL